MPFYGDPYTPVSAINDTGGILLSRTIGVTPAFVQVSASAITATGTSRPYETLEFSWDFGDPSGTESLTNPANGGASVNPNTSQVGPEAAYVYRTAGTYTITLTIRGDDGDGGYVTETCQATFTVTAFEADVEYYFDSLNGNNAWNGQSPTFVSGSTGPKASMAGFDYWPTVSVKTAYHFARGGTYDYDSGHRDGMRVDAYGSGAKPILNLTGTNGIYFNIGSPDQHFDDIVWSGVDFRNNGIGRSFFFNVSNGSGTWINHLYVDNCSFSRTSATGLTWIQMAGNMEGFGLWNTSFDGGDEIVSSDYLGSTYALGNSACEWRFMVGVTMINGVGDHTIDNPYRAAGHNVYTGSENHQLYRYSSFGSGAKNRYFCFNGNIDGDSSSRCYYWNLSDCELTGMWGAIDLGNEYNNPAISGSMDAVVIERNWIHAMSNESAEDWTNPGTPPPTTFANNDQWIVYASCALNYTMRSNTFATDCPRADGNGTGVPLEDDIFALSAYGAPRVYDNVVGNVGYEVNPLSYDGGAISGFEYNNLPSSDNPTDFSGDLSGTGSENGGAITGTLIVDDDDGIATPNFTVTADGTHGTATINSSTGAWSYTPDADWFGSDSFIVRVTDDLDNNDYQIISITVTEAGGGGGSPTTYFIQANGQVYVFQTGGA